MCNIHVPRGATCPRAAYPPPLLLTNRPSPPLQSSGDTRDVYVADLDLTRGNGSASSNAASRIAVPADTTVDDPRGGAASTSSSTAIQLSRDNEALKVELTGVREELARSAEQVQALTVQLADKERSLQAAKADMIETRLELQRNEERLRVRTSASYGACHPLLCPSRLCLSRPCQLVDTPPCKQCRRGCRRCERPARSTGA